MMWRCMSVVLLSGLILGTAWSASDRLIFDTPQENRHFYALLKEFRCVVCQNQDLLESHANIAEDLKREVYHWVRAGHSDAEIRQWLQQRYGDFILFKPKVSRQTWLLWFGPLIWVLTGLGVMCVWMWRGREHG